MMARPFVIIRLVPDGISACGKGRQSRWRDREPMSLVTDVWAELFHATRHKPALKAVTVPILIVCWPKSVSVAQIEKGLE